VKSLADLRKGNNLTQKELADLLGISAAAVSMYESGVRNPPFKRVREIAKLFGISSDDIFFKSIAHDGLSNDVL
jgi:transcriptional regulator with XRE-family HTH domain